MNQITFKVKPEVKARLKEIADNEGLSIADIVRLAIRDKLQMPFFYANKCGVNNRNNSGKAEGK